MRSGPGQAVPTSHWQEAKPWIEEWTAVQRHWTKILLGHKARCPGAQAQMCVSLGLRILSVSKMSPSPDRQRAVPGGFSEPGRAGVLSLLGILMGPEAT